MSKPTTPYEPVKESFDGERLLRGRMQRDLVFYAEKNLKINLKEGGVAPLVFNKAQKFIHTAIEKQLGETGRVRALVLKARQQGCSTYAAARFYWKITHRKGVNAFVLSHAIDTTRKLFSISRRMHEHSDPGWKPDTQAASAHEMVFSGYDSSYFVGTAGSKETGRGGTIHYLHGSEVGFWANAEYHFAGIMQSIPTGTLDKGTEIILESTGNGEVGKFYELCELAKKGEGEYIVIFTPWFWQAEYRKPPISGWTIKDSKYSDALEHACDAYGISEDQAYWMHFKMLELGEGLFKQEYPATYDEAFQTVASESFVPVNEVLEAMVPKSDVIEMDSMACIGALDPAGVGVNADRTAIGHMIGSRVYPVEYIKHKNTVELVQIVIEYIQKHNIDRFYIDNNGLGVGIYEALVHTHNLGHIVKPCNFGSGATDLNSDGTPMYKNMRAQCAGRFLKWLRSGKRELPQQDELRKDLCAPKRLDVRPQQVESKKDMKSRGVASPDGGDVVWMFFTYPVESVKRLRYYGGSDTVDPSNKVPDYDELNFGLSG